MADDFSDDVRRRAREVCKLIARDGTCTDKGEPSEVGPKCDPTNCFIFELIEMGRVGHPE